MERRVERSRYFRFDDSYLGVRRERLLGDISGRRLTHPGLAGVPTPSTLHPRGVATSAGCPHRKSPRECLLLCDVISVTTERPSPRGDFSAAARRTSIDSAMPVAMSSTPGTLSGQTLTHRSITSAWEVTVIVNPQPSTSGSAVYMPMTLAPAQYAFAGFPDTKETVPWQLGDRHRARPKPL